jgi:hypothetical protein
MQKKLNSNAGGEQAQEEVAEAEVQSVISNADRLEQIAEQLGFDAIKESNPARFVRDWLNQFSGFFGLEGGNDRIRQNGGRGNDQLNAEGRNGNDRIRQNGRAGNDQLNAIGGAGIDRIVQRGGRGKDILKAIGNSGNDKLIQKGGKGNDKLKAIGGRGNDRITQKGGRGRDTLKAKGGKGNDRIKQKGGRGRDHLIADGGKGNDRIKQKGGKGNDILEYKVSAGQDVVNLNGGRGKDTAIIHTNGHAVVVQDKKGKVLFASGGQNKNYNGGGTTIKVRSIETLDIRTPENQVEIPEIESIAPVSVHPHEAQIPDPDNQNGVTDVAAEVPSSVNKNTPIAGPKTPVVDESTPGVEVSQPKDTHTENPSVSTPTLDAPTTSTPTQTSPPTQVTNPSVPAPSGSNTGPEICSVYTRSTEVLFSEEAVDVYFNARDAEWDDLTWDYSWSGAVSGSVTNEGPTTWIKTGFNLPALNVIAGQSIKVDAVVRDPSGASDTESITIDVIGEEIAVWEVFFDSESVNSDGTGTPVRIDPLIFDLNKDGKLDITGANQEGDGKIDGEGVLFDMDPSKQGKTGWKWSSPGHRPGYYHGGENSRAPKVPNGTVVYNTGKTESTNKAGVGRWFEDRSKGSKADIFDENGNLVGMWDKSTWGESHQGRIGQYYWEPSGNGDKRERTEWIKGTGDGFLVWDHNNNGIIDDNTEMMSEFDKDGKKQFDNGFEKLGHYFDKDKDGVIKGSELNDLKFWVDDGDAITEDGELKSLDSYGITEIVLPNAGGMQSTSTIGKTPG